MSFNPKGTFFWCFLGAAAICGVMAHGPMVGVYAFVVLAISIALLG